MTGTAPATGVVVGFDLDQTLIDTTPAIAASLLAAADEVGAELDIPALPGQLGPDPGDLLEAQVPPDVAARIATAYQRIYLTEGLAQATLLPGARQAVAAVARHGCSALVVTGQPEDASRRHLAHQSLPIDTVVGSAGGTATADALLAHGAAVYVGGQPVDLRAARSAGVVGVAVPTGGYTAAELSDADVVLPSLCGFSGWLGKYLAARNGSADVVQPDR